MLPVVDPSWKSHVHHPRAWVSHFQTSTHTLRVQVPPEKGFNPSKPTQNTFLGGVWTLRDMYSKPFSLEANHFRIASPPKCSLEEQVDELHQRYVDELRKAKAFGSRRTVCLFIARRSFGDIWCRCFFLARGGGGACCFCWCFGFLLDFVGVYWRCLSAKKEETDEETQQLRPFLLPDITRYTIDLKHLKTQCFVQLGLKLYKEVVGKQPKHCVSPTPKNV